MRFSKRITVLLVALLLLTVVVTVSNGCTPATGEYSTSDIANYATVDHKWLPFFPAAIPENAIVHYHYYSRNTANVDEFLMLTFSNDADLNAFLYSILGDAEESAIFKRVNPYNNRYTEYFSKTYCDYTREGLVNVMTCTPELDIEATFHALNVSNADRTVVISYTGGSIPLANHTPMYLQYFRVTVDPSLDDVVQLNPIETETESDSDTEPESDAETEAESGTNTEFEGDVESATAQESETAT